MKESSTVNIRKIAGLARCAPSTVSRVLSGRDDAIKIGAETRKRILEVCEELDYHPSIHAARLFSKRAKVVAFLVALPELIDDDNLSRSLFGVYRALERKGYRTLPLTLTKDFLEAKEHLNIFKRQEADGLIVWGARDEHTFLDEVAGDGHPLMLLMNPVKGHPCVSSDQKEAIARLVKLCAARGATRFAGLMSREGASFRRRTEGFVETAGPDATILYAPQTPEGGYEMAPKLLKCKADAIICGNDECAVGVERYLLERGVKIPQDVLLTGGDMIRLSAHCQVPISSFDQRAADCGERCAEALLRGIETGAELESASLEAPVVERQSTLRV